MESKGKIDSDYQSLAEEMFEKGEGYRTVVTLKGFSGNKYIDLRKWFKFKESKEYRPTGKGICLEPEDWRKAMPMIERMLEKAK